MLEMLSVEINLLTLVIICILSNLSHILREYVALLSLLIISLILLLINLLVLLLTTKYDFLSIFTYFTIVHIL